MTAHPNGLRRLAAPVLVLCLLAGCAGGGEDATAPDDAPDDAPDAAGDGAPGEVADGTTLTLGMPVESLGYLAIDAGRGFGTFADEGLDVDYAIVSGGDTTLMAALGSDDVQLAAPGSSSALQAISMGEDLQIVYSLMSRMSIDLTVTDAFMTEAGVTPEDDLPDRLAALDGITIGVSGLGGAQDRIAQWLGTYAGLDDGAIETVNIGPPPALRAAAEEGQIDGYVLTAPNDAIAESEGFGRRLIRLGEEIPGLDEYHHTVLVIDPAFGEEQPEVVTAVVRSLQAASERAASDTATLVEQLHSDQYAQLDLEVVQDSVEGLLPGIESGGELTAESIAFALSFAEETGYPMGEQLDVADGEGVWWTNTFVERAAEG